MSNFSGFLSSFTNASGSSPYIDLMSKITLNSDQTSGYIGPLLINFSTNSATLPGANKTQITFPKAFTQVYGVIGICLNSSATFIVPPDTNYLTNSSFYAEAIGGSNAQPISWFAWGLA